MVSLPSGVDDAAIRAAAANRDKRRDIEGGRNGNATPATASIGGQRVECDAGIVHPFFGPMKVNGEGALRPQRGRSECSPQPFAAGPSRARRRRYATRRPQSVSGRPVGNKGSVPMPAIRPLLRPGVPAQQICKAVGRRALRIEKTAEPSEVIGHRAVVVARRRGSECPRPPSPGGGDGLERAVKHAAAGGDFHIRHFSLVAALTECDNKACWRCFRCCNRAPVWRFRSPHHFRGKSEMRTSEPKPH